MAPQLADISRSGRAELYGIAYEDNSAAVREFLKETDDPFARLDLDADVLEGAACGIYGVPETIVIDRKGIVRLRYAGSIVPNTLANVIMPAIETAAGES
jgi:cytochrome c biogenesis protein CcmG, thiol:disulfide interchange protein DsbE